MFKRLFCRHSYSQPYFSESIRSFRSYCIKCNLIKLVTITDQGDIDKQLQKIAREHDFILEKTLKYLLKRYGQRFTRKSIYSEDGIIYIQNFTDSDYYIAWVRKDDK